MSSRSSMIPGCAWTRRLDQNLDPDINHNSSKPPAMEIITLLPVAYRVASYLYSERKANREPIFDLNFTLGGMEPPHTGPYNGVPLGGIGSGAMGIGYRGEYRRWSLHPGKYISNIVQGNVFSVRVERGSIVHTQVLSVFDGDLAKNMKDWKWSMPASKATYHALYPRAWTVYVEPVPGINIVIRQISPVIPHSYSESSLPTGVFIVEVENIGENASVSIMFSFENSNGEVEKHCRNKPHASFIIETKNNLSIQGVCMSRTKSFKSLERHRKLRYDQCSLSIASTLGDCFTYGHHIKPSSVQHTDNEHAYSKNHKDTLTICRKFIISDSLEDTDSTAQELWDRFHLHGEISSFVVLDNHNEYAEVGAAICIKKFMPSKAKKLFPFSVAWDNPVARFGDGRGHYRYYTNFFSKTGLSSPSIAAYALANVEEWEHRIFKWQDPILSNDSLTDAYKCLLFNELYYITDGGTIWTIVNDEEKMGREDIRGLSISIDMAGMTGAEAPSPFNILSPNETDEVFVNIERRSSAYGVNREDLCKSTDSQSILRSTRQLMEEHDNIVQKADGKQFICGRFLYLEGHEYLMYNTYDVHFYASFSLIELWPMIELSIQRDYAAAVYIEDLSVRTMLGHGPPSVRKIQGCVPHDLGSPSEDPWNKVNIYNFQDVCNWKDLGPKFVLQVYRDYIHTKSQKFLRDMYSVVVEIMVYTEKFDTDGDGMIENSGFPDQTYDIWIAKGIHAYCGGLWITSLFATAAMASLLSDKPRIDKYSELGVKARKIYNEALWNGTYLNYDSSTSNHHDSIMADMLAGQWYAIECNLPRIVSASRAYSCFKTIFDNNVVDFGKGKLIGAVNGYRPDKTVDSSCLQSREVWTGTTYALAAAMLLEGGRVEDWHYEHCTFHLDARFYETDTITDAQRRELFNMAMVTAQGIYNAGWMEFGYWFVTPEAWEFDGSYRSKGYMRPLSVWAMQSALAKSKF